MPTELPWIGTLGQNSTVLNIPREDVVGQYGPSLQPRTTAESCMLLSDSSEIYLKIIMRAVIWNLSICWSACYVQGTVEEGKVSSV